MSNLVQSLHEYIIGFRKSIHFIHDNGARFTRNRLNQIIVCFDRLPPSLCVVESLSGLVTYNANNLLSPFRSSSILAASLGVLSAAFPRSSECFDDAFWSCSIFWGQIPRITVEKRCRGSKPGVYDAQVYRKFAVFIVIQHTAWSWRQQQYFLACGR